MYTMNAYSLSSFQSILKRGFDLVVAFVCLLCLWWLVLIAWVLASIDTRSNGFFIQQRVGKGGRLFRVVKIKTMRPDSVTTTTVTRAGDPRITRLGHAFRKTKIDELPQLWNVLIGDMSFVGPRPDVPGFADKLNDDDKIILSIRPGITGPATLRFRDEEKLLASVNNPEKYNIEVIFPEKVRINKEYIKNYSLFSDLKYIFITIFG